MRPLAVALFALAGCAGTAAPPEQPSSSPPVVLRCFDRTIVLKKFLDDYAESPLWAGLSRDGRVYEILRSDESWTLTITQPNGQTCPLTWGDHSELIGDRS